MVKVAQYVTTIIGHRSGNLLTVLLLAGMAVSPSLKARAVDLKPDPLALLRGVEQTRKSCQPGRLEVTILITFPMTPTKSPMRYRLNVAFDGINRRYDQFQKIVWTKPGNKSGAESEMERLKRMGGDTEAFVRAGYGEFKDIHLRSSYDGLQFLQYAEEMGARIMDQTQGTPDFVFDPRILGICDEFGIQRTIANSLFYEKAKSITLVGREAIDGKDTWRVHIIDRNNDNNDFWVQGNNSFRVLKSSMKMKYVEVENVSTFRDGNDWPLPEKVVNRKFDLKTGKVARQIEVTITKAEFGVTVDPKLWTLAGLGIPVGKLVIDERQQKIAGHFDGEGVTTNYSAAVRKGREAEKRPLRWIIAVSGLTTLAVVAALFIKRRNWLREGKG